MAEDTGQERTEEATPKRREEARKKGDIPRSRDLTTMLMLLAAASSLIGMGQYMLSALSNTMTGFFQRAGQVNIKSYELPGIFMKGINDMLWQMLPFVLVMVAVAVIAPLLLSGWNFSFDAVKFKVEKLNPGSGFKRMFGPNGLMEMVKALLKFVVIAVVAIALIWLQMGEIMTISKAEIQPALAHAGEMILWTFLIVSAATLLIAAVDVPHQLMQHSKKLKMTRDQIKQESKDTDGSPELKSKIRQRQNEMARMRMMQEVPEADVIVTNPTHYSVALKYDSEQGGAPRVVAKGVDAVAFRIREIGQENHVPVLETPPLARALYYSTELNQEIPAGLYKAVAQILAYVFQLKAAKQPNGRDAALPVMPEDLPIPDELKR